MGAEQDGRKSGLVCKLVLSIACLFLLKEFFYLLFFGCVLILIWGSSKMIWPKVIDITEMVKELRRKLILGSGDLALREGFQ